MMKERLEELVGMLMIGEGAVALVEPRRHLELWREGPPYWRRMVDPFLERPVLTRCLGAAEVALGFWLVSRQLDRAATTDGQLAHARERDLESV